MYSCITTTQIKLYTTSSSQEDSLLPVSSQYFLHRGSYYSDLFPCISFATGSFRFPSANLYPLCLLAPDPLKPPPHPLPPVRLPKALHPPAQLSATPVASVTSHELQAAPALLTPRVCLGGGVPHHPHKPTVPLKQ